MYRFYILPVLAVAGIILVIRTVIAGSVPQKVAAPVVQPPKAPYPAFVAGSGIVEASSENIAIASPLPGVVKQVFVSPGDTVAKGQALFSLDDRDALAEIEVRRAQVERTRAELQDAETQLGIYRGVPDERALVRGELLKRQSAAAVAKGKLLEAQAQLKAAETTHDRMTVRSPIDGQVLQAKIRAGEFAPAQVTVTPLMLLGTVSKIAVRVDVDENDAWRVKAGAPATAVLRGNTSISFPLAFSRFEPYVVPKRSLTGESTERVDTRVLQVVYTFEPQGLPVYVGQLVDAFIEAPAPAQ